jgi:hypothetical protein
VGGVGDCSAVVDGEAMTAKNFMNGAIIGALRAEPFASSCVSNRATNLLNHGWRFAQILFEKKEIL